MYQRDPLRRPTPETITRWLGFARRLNAGEHSAASQMTLDEPTRPHFYGDESFRRMFGDQIVWITVVSLLPSQQIVAHCDQPLPDGVIRYHLPLQTNFGCWSYHGGDWQQLDVGRVYSMDPAVEHGAVNWGSEIRMHLLLDVRGGK